MKDKNSIFTPGRKIFLRMKPVKKTAEMRKRQVLGDTTLTAESTMNSANKFRQQSVSVSHWPLNGQGTCLGM